MSGNEELVNVVPAEPDADDEQPQVSIEIDLDAEEGFYIEDGTIAASSVSAPEPPEIPPFLDSVRLDQITPEIQRRLSLILDLPSASNALKNWEWLASYLGMPAEEITYIRERALYPESPTREVLRRYGRENFGRLLRIIRDSLNRYDVIIQLLPFLFAFEEHLRSTRPRQEAAACASTDIKSENDSSPSIDSGIVEVSQAANASVSGVFGRSSASVSIIGRPIILITFAEDNRQHRKLVMWLCKNLENANARAILDETLATSAADDWTGRVTECFSQARSIIVVCSPEYIHRVDSNSTQNDAGGMVDMHGQCSRFIYQLMCSEYRQNNCRNRRFRPVVFQSAPGGMEIVPPILRNTVIHQWPRQHNDMMKFIFDDEPRTPSR